MSKRSKLAASAAKRRLSLSLHSAKPCPFCSMHPGGILGDFTGFRVWCICGAYGPFVPERSDAIDAWNQRPAPHPHEEN